MKAQLSVLRTKFFVS